jgi:hypothetical protein
MAPEKTGGNDGPGAFSHDLIGTDAVRAQQDNLRDLDKLASWRMSVLELGHPQPGRTSEKAKTRG